LNKTNKINWKRIKNISYDYLNYCVWSFDLLDFLLLRNENDRNFDFDFFFGSNCWLAVDVDNVALLLIVGVCCGDSIAEVFFGVFYL
jgi:hypothetical protein